MVDSVLNTLPEFGQRLRAALVLLLEGNLCAQDTGQSDWEFAVEVIDLQSAGLSKNAIRWLVFKGYARHAVETTKALGKPGRQFRHTINLLFPSPSCLVPTKAGIDFVREMGIPPTIEAFPAVKEVETATRLPPACIPRWDRDTRTLWVGDTVVKQFKVPADNQELILSVFQEEGWPPKIDDPLPPAGEIDAKRRLHDSINRLNRNQKNRLICFSGNGNGKAVRWKVIEQVTAG